MKSLTYAEIPELHGDKTPPEKLEKSTSSTSVSVRFKIVQGKVVPVEFSAYRDGIYPDYNTGEFPEIEDGDLLEEMINELLGGEELEKSAPKFLKVATKAIAAADKPKTAAGRILTALAKKPLAKSTPDRDDAGRFIEAPLTGTRDEKAVKLATRSVDGNLRTWLKSRQGA